MWGGNQGDQYNMMIHMMDSVGMPVMNAMGPPTSIGLAPPPMPPMAIMGDWEHNQQQHMTSAPIGPVAPGNNITSGNENGAGGKPERSSDRTSTSNKSDPRGRNRSRSNERDRDRGDRKREYRDRRRGHDRSDRSSKWETHNEPANQISTSNDMNTSSSPMQYSQSMNQSMDNNMINMAMMQQSMNNQARMPNMPQNMTGQNMGMQNMPNQMSMANMPNQMSMANMPNQMSMANMPNQMGMANMGLPSMPMQNMMHAQMLMMRQQALYLTNSILLPPIPGVLTPVPRERPQGCRTIFVGGLPEDISKDVIQEIFQRFGGISEVIMVQHGAFHVRFDVKESVDSAFMMSGFRYRTYNQTDNEATTVFVDYAKNPKDQDEFARNKHNRALSPKRIENFSHGALSALVENITKDNEFVSVAPTLLGWLERGECNNRNSNVFYSLIQAANNQIHRLYNEKMQIDEEFQTLKNTIRDKFQVVLTQLFTPKYQRARMRTLERFKETVLGSEHVRTRKNALSEYSHALVPFTSSEQAFLEYSKNAIEHRKNALNLFTIEQVANILSVANKQEVAANFTKQQRRNIEMWHKMTEDLDNMKEEFESYFNDEDNERYGKDVVPLEKYEALKNENTNLNFELDGYKNEAFLAKNEAERKFEKFKAHFIAQQALDNNITPVFKVSLPKKPPVPAPPAPAPKETRAASPPPSSDAKLISLLTIYLISQPFGVTFDNIVTYIHSVNSDFTQTEILNVLKRYSDIFELTIKNGAKWKFITLDKLKNNK